MYLSIEDCWCYGYFGGNVSSLDPLSFTCASTTGDDCIGVVTDTKKVVFDVINDPSGGCYYKCRRGDVNDIKVGDLAFNLNYGCRVHAFMWDEAE